MTILTAIVCNLVDALTWPSQTAQSLWAASWCSLPQSPHPDQPLGQHDDQNPAGRYCECILVYHSFLSFIHPSLSHLWPLLTLSLPSSIPLPSLLSSTSPSPSLPHYLHPQPSSQLQIGSLEQVLLAYHRSLSITRHSNRKCREDSILDEPSSQLKPQCQFILRRSSSDGWFSGLKWLTIYPTEGMINCLRRVYGSWQQVKKLST